MIEKKDLFAVLGREKGRPGVVIGEEERVQRCEIVKGMKEESGCKKVDQF